MAAKSGAGVSAEIWGAGLLYAFLKRPAFASSFMELNAPLQAPGLHILPRFHLSLRISGLQCYKYIKWGIFVEILIMLDYAAGMGRYLLFVVK